MRTLIAATPSAQRNPHGIALLQSLAAIVSFRSCPYLSQMRPAVKHQDQQLRRWWIAFPLLMLSIVAEAPAAALSRCDVVASTSETQSIQSDVVEAEEGDLQESESPDGVLPSGLSISRSAPGSATATSMASELRSSAFPYQARAPPVS